jgi:hypothetical protein
MFEFLAVSTVQFDKKLLEEVARSTKAFAVGPPVRGASEAADIELAQQLVEEYFPEEPGCEPLPPSP